MNEHVGRDGFDLRDDDVWIHFVEERTKGLWVEHREDARLVGDLHGGRVRVTIRGHHVNAEALRFNRNLFAEFARTQQQHHESRDCGGGAKGDGSDAHAGSRSSKKRCGGAGRRPSWIAR